MARNPKSSHSTSVCLPENVVLSAERWETALPGSLESMAGPLPHTMVLEHWTSLLSSLELLQHVSPHRYHVLEQLGVIIVAI